MSIKPILFNGDMVRAILDGRKTVTRRKIDVDISNRFDIEIDGTVICYIDQATGDSYKPTDLCRYQQGDILYVRETILQALGSTLMQSGETETYWCSNGPFEYVADGAKPRFLYPQRYDSPYMQIRPSIHMPKEAARIWLKVTNVRVERLQDITNDEVLKEGMNAHTIDNYIRQMPENSLEYIHAAHVLPFVEAWNGTVKKIDIERYGWDANPWVWVIKFERCEKPEEENKNAD